MSDQMQPNDSNNNREFICGVVEGFYGKPWTFEQRYDLFSNLKAMKLNSFMYAPKDDTKHRANWRELYNEKEADELRNLIEEAKVNGIDFYYSLAPGLDIVYSDPDEIDCLTSKFDQLVELGCQCFAILFDDIEPKMTNEKDCRTFKSYSLAQVSVTNLIFDHLNKPKFLFCPTEYCESRAVPDVMRSPYLNTIGSGLNEGIDIMWTGPRVISKLITLKSIEELAKVLRRPPVIWENLHANDYDKRRIFLGPYSGRSTHIIPKLRGVLTNPNCEYEINHIAIHTLAQWIRCTRDANSNNRCDPKRKTPLESLESDSPIFDNSVSNPETGLYDPQRALAFAIKDWLPKLMKTKSFVSDIGQLVEGTTKLGGDQLEIKIEDKFSLTNLTLLVELFYLPFEHGSYGQSILDEIKWLRDNSDSIIVKEKPAYSCDKRKSKSPEKNQADASSSMDSSPAPEMEQGGQVDSRIGPEDYDSDEGDSRDAPTCVVDAETWRARADKLTLLCTDITNMANYFLNDCPNKGIVSELYPYLMDLKETIQMIKEFLRFLLQRSSTEDSFHDGQSPRYSNKSSKSSIDPSLTLTEEQETWVHRGGLLADIYRLIW